MKIFFLALWLISCGQLCAFAQSENTVSADWRIFAPENEEFSAEVPIPLGGTQVPNLLAAIGSRNNDKTAESRRYLNSLDGTYFYIFSDDWKTPGQLKYALNFAYDQNQLETTQNSGELMTKKFEFLDRWDFYHVILTVNGKNRIYVFHTISPTKENPSVERFFKSIKFNEKLLLENSSDSKTEKTITVTVPTADPEIPAQSPAVKVSPPARKGGSGTPDGLGIGCGGGCRNEPANNAAPSVPGATAGVKILTKPRADYTDFARFYEVSGKVLLRVTFSANGTVGAITPLKKLPFGLTEQAVRAARGITFEPAMRAGVPYSVTKPVEYSFTIY